MAEVVCPHCKQLQDPRVVYGDFGPHHAKLFCSKCGRFTWMPKPDADKIRRPARLTEIWLSNTAGDFARSVFALKRNCRTERRWSAIMLKSLPKKAHQNARMFGLSAQAATLSFTGVERK